MYEKKHTFANNMKYLRLFYTNYIKYIPSNSMPNYHKLKKISEIFSLILTIITIHLP